MKFRKLKVGAIEFAVLMEDRHYNRLRESRFFRYVLTPLLNSVRQGRTSQEATGRSAAATPGGMAALAEREGTVDRIEAGNKRMPEQEALLSRIADIAWWYHSIDLGHGIVTPGLFDHTPALHEYCLPDTLEGKRVLDVATFDGFWAFEFERRGAAEVVAMDIERLQEIDLPPAVRMKVPEEDLNRKTVKGFTLAKDILGSQVKRQILNVYDLSSDKTGKFHMVFCSDLLVHLMNPVKALQNIRSVVTECAYIVELFDPQLDLCSVDNAVRYGGASEDFIWWMFGLKALEHMIRDSGFGQVELLNTFRLGYRGDKEGPLHAVFRALP